MRGNGKLLMTILWPAFLAACMLELLVFGLVDPEDLRWFGDGPLHTRQAIYALAFAAFWAVAIGSSAMTSLLGRPAEDPRGQQEP